MTYSAEDAVAHSEMRPFFITYVGLEHWIPFSNRGRSIPVKTKELTEVYYLEKESYLHDYFKTQAKTWLFAVPSLKFNFEKHI